MVAMDKTGWDGGSDNESALLLARGSLVGSVDGGGGFLQRKVQQAGEVCEGASKNPPCHLSLRTTYPNLS